MFLGDLPQTVVTLAVWTYWTSVCVLVSAATFVFAPLPVGSPAQAAERGCGHSGYRLSSLADLPAIAGSATSSWFATPQVA